MLFTKKKYHIPDCPYVSEHAILVYRDFELQANPGLVRRVYGDGEPPEACAVVKIQYAIELERKLNAALAELKTIKNIHNNLGLDI